jgi:lipopolysaccharide/colanic/teichoic acid biosynthesis glycosyltransferase
MDIAGSLLALVLVSPLFIVIAAIIKLTSRGPVLYRQDRVGQHGRKFTFLKFRSMYFASDHTIHKEFVKRLIGGAADGEEENGRKSEVFKLTNDPRITPLGKFLRKTSLDEIPQFLNVLSGSMSLVGPRPPVPYEFECYQMWHRQRLVAVKPGITGAWQVGGRSKTTFDEMVRMDLKYASSWTPWTDFKILLRTPRAVLSGEGAY